METRWAARKRPRGLKPYKLSPNGPSPSNQSPPVRLKGTFRLKE
ncbi:hypothetical protein PanWU01x14_276230 [Parasponia andersonii]|uniref:Uncharacterized protein n=1 Tax=Parasponia andersonii TaxID=3476 RepID=A0A2P5B2Z3_PARAD|nr:hypothetical protein PanWU01x14_276230 [Parasponia andersonii]